MKLIRLKEEDVVDFKKYMQESFQYGCESVYGNDKLQVLSEKDIDEYLEHNELGLAFEVLCVSIERDKIKISQKDYEIINTLGFQMEMDNNLWVSLKNNIIK